MILFASLAIVAGWLVVLGLPRLWSPADETAGFDRASIDRYWAQLAPPGNTPGDAAEAALRRAGALRVTWIRGRLP